MSAAILVLCDDLLFWARIEAAARLAGTPVRRAAGPEDARAAVAAGDVRRVLADLGSRSLDAAALAAEWKAGGRAPELVGFASHVDLDVQRRAREAGFDRVLARSAFVRELASLLR